MYSCESDEAQFVDRLNSNRGVYDRRDDFGFPIVIFPWLSGNVPRLQSYGNYIGKIS